MKVRVTGTCVGLVSAVGAVGLCLAMSQPASQGADAPQFGDTFLPSRDNHAIQYTARDATDPVARLNRRLANGQTRLRFESGSGYLRSLMTALNVPVESQVVVFSRTSLQADRISPKNPRAIVFNDAVAVAWPRGGFIEVAAIDPEQGAIFYKLPQVPTSSPALVRSDDTCLACHATSATLGVPGLATASVVPESDGLVSSAPARIVDHRTPIALRWGGWYVTATRLPMPHMGNLVAADPEHPALVATPDSIERQSLGTVFDTSDYPSTHSDIVALMVLNHQTRMINLMTRMGWETRVAQAGAQPARGGPSGSNAGVPSLADWVREVVDYMLFIDEAPLSGPIEGTSGFAEKFASAGLRDRRGRSLRDLDLHQRLLRYPCSYLIYSDQFDHLPIVARRAIYARLQQVLSGAEKSPRYARLSADDRRAISEILRDTKKDAADYLSGSPSDVAPR
jgi:hypothetical protein